MTLMDYCPGCGRPEHEHTSDELRVCWEVTRIEVDEFGADREVDDDD